MDPMTHVQRIVRSGECRPVSRRLLPPDVVRGLDAWYGPVRFYLVVPGPLVDWTRPTDWGRVAIFPEGTRDYRHWVGRRFQPPGQED